MPRQNRLEVTPPPAHELGPHKSSDNLRVQVGNWWQGEDTPHTTSWHKMPPLTRHQLITYFNHHNSCILECINTSLVFFHPFNRTLFYLPNWFRTLSTLFQTTSWCQTLDDFLFRVVKVINLTFAFGAVHPTSQYKQTATECHHNLSSDITTSKPAITGQISTSESPLRLVEFLF